MGSALVIEGEPGAVGRLGDWLAEAGLDLTVTDPAADSELDGFAALVVVGTAPVAADGVAAVLRAAVEAGLPTLAIGSGSRLLAAAYGGSVAPAAAGPAAGPALVARRDQAEADPLFARVPFTPDVLLWQADELTLLPPGAVLLAAGTRHPHQAYRIGDAAWGLEFHIEPDSAMVERWAAADPDLVRQAGRTPAEVVAACAAAQDDLFEVWQPFATRFAAVARGDAPPGVWANGRPTLPMAEG